MLAFNKIQTSVYNIITLNLCTVTDDKTSIYIIQTDSYSKSWYRKPMCLQLPG